MNNKSDPLTALKAVKDELGLTLPEELIEGCYKLQSNHQYDKDRPTVKKMQALVEEEVLKREGGQLL